MPFIESVAIAVIKKALKKAILKVASDAVTKGAEKAIIDNLIKAGSKVLGDTDALLLNRMKKSPDKTIINYLSKSMGVPTGEIKKIVKVFNQTPQATLIAKGNNFKKAIKNRALKELKLDKLKRLKDLPRKFNEFDARKKPPDKINYNLYVKNKLKTIQVSFTNKINDADFRNKRKQSIAFDTDIMQFYDPQKKYTKFNCANLDAVEKLMDFDLLAYIEGSDDLLLSYQSKSGKHGEEIGGWERYSMTGMTNYIETFREIVQDALL